MSDDRQFDATPDREIRALLRDHLEGSDSERFVRRVIAGLPLRPATSWDILARWTRPGLAAAAVIALALGAWLAAPRVREPVGEPLLELSGTADSELLMTAMIREP